MGKYKITWRGEEAQRLLKKAVMQEALRCAADLQGESAREAPVDTGDLRANCNVSRMKEDGEKAWYEVGYDLPYARIQHERLDFNHPKGGKAKFLEDPFNRNKKQYDTAIKGKAKEALRREK